MKNISAKVNKATHYIYYILSCTVFLGWACSCNDSDVVADPGSSSADNAINIGGIETEDLTVATRATDVVGVDAETIDWLVQPLEQGLDITYGLYGVSKEDSHEDVAILKLTDKTTTPATYEFKYRADRSAQVGESNYAIWYNNGPHYFQGVHVPGRIRYTSAISEIEATDHAPGLTTDQHDGTATGTDAQLGNYTLLSHYLGMPANYRLTATIERIKLPFRHRLARVVAFVLIDPDLHTTLKGYKKNADGSTDVTEDPNTTSIRFCNVKVLQGVKDEVETGGHHNLTPEWTTARKVIPHFDGERGSYDYSKPTQAEADADFKMYVSADKKTEVYPSTKTQDWKKIHDAAGHQGYTEVNYGRVPVYDIIVRPTYTNTDNVMYDEKDYETRKTELANVSNSIDFEIELENGLRYEKKFEFDLDANFQTVVYLRISRLQVDYNAAGSDRWIESKENDDWYGVDNENENTLSMAGSSWQRAYRTTSISDDKVTDGDLYNNGEDVGQYLGNSTKWMSLLLQACEGGKHHGDYFILDNDITIDAQQIPKDFVFTGHLDAQDHEITLTGMGKKVVDVEEWYEDKYETPEEADYSSTLFVKNSAGEFVVYTMPDLYIYHEATTYSEEEAKEINAEHQIDYVIPAVIASRADIEAAIAVINKDGYQTGDNPEAERIAVMQEGDEIIPAQTIHPEETGYEPTYPDGYTLIDAGNVKEEAYYEKAVPQPTIAELMNSSITYYEKTGENSYVVHKPTLYANHPIYHPEESHTSPSYLFKELNGKYTTNQETVTNPYAAGIVWEANVHKETNKSTVWVPTLGYRAEVLNAVIKGGTLFPAEATSTTITGNVQNCFNIVINIVNEEEAEEKVAVTYTPNIPQYK